MLRKKLKKSKYVVFFIILIVTFIMISCNYNVEKGYNDFDLTTSTQENDPAITDSKISEKEIIQLKEEAKEVNSIIKKFTKIEIIDINNSGIVDKQNEIGDNLFSDNTRKSYNGYQYIAKRQFSNKDRNYINAYADFNGDGQIDRAYRKRGYNQWVVYYAGGKVNYSFARDGLGDHFRIDTHEIHVIGDFNGDKIADIAWRRSYWASWVVSLGGLNNTSSVVNIGDGRSGDFRVYDRHQIHLTGDFNGDKIDDIAWRRSYWGVWRINFSNRPSSYYNDGRSGDFRVYDGNQTHQVIDFNKDGMDDLLWTRRGWGKTWRITYGGNKGSRLIQR